MNVNFTIFSIIDLFDGYFLALAKEDVLKTGLITPFGLFDFTRMVLGWTNALISNQQDVANILNEAKTDKKKLDNSMILLMFVDC